MEHLRWILLAVGLLFIVVVYLVGRRRSQVRKDREDAPTDDLPELNTENWDDLDEAVGEVRIIARADDEIEIDTGFTTRDDDRDDNSLDQGGVVHEHHETASAETEPRADVKPDDEPVREAAPPQSESVIVLSVIARANGTFTGSSINSVAKANALEFGQFDIYHRMDADGNPVFSLVNIIEPGSFDPDTLHELKTPGIALFMQLPGPAQPLQAFDDMLLTAHKIAEMLDGRLCNQRRKPLTEPEVEAYRNTAAAFDGQV